MPSNKQYGHQQSEKKSGGVKTLAILGPVALWAMAVCAWGASRIAALAGYDEVLGKPLFSAFDRLWYAPWKLIEWADKYSSYSQVKDVVDQTYLAGVGIPLLAGLIYLACQQGLKGRVDLHGSAHWASIKEVEKTGLLSSRGVYVGGWRHPKSKKLHYLRHDGPEHILVFAATRSGKGVGLIIPTLLGWAHSTIVLDIKGENWALTSGYLKSKGQRVLRFEPTDESGTAARYNPLAEVRLDSAKAISDVQRLSSIILDPLGKGLDDYWGKAANGFFSGAILHCIIMTRHGKDRSANLADLSLMLEDPDRSVAAVFDEMLKTDHAALLAKIYPHLLKAVEEKNEKGQIISKTVNKLGDAAHLFIASAARGMLQKADNELSGVVNTATANLSLYRDPVIAENLYASDFTINDLMNGDQPTNLYLVVNPEKIKDLVPLIRIILTQIIGRLISKMDFADGASQAGYKHRLLLMLDEFPALGKLPALVEAQPYMAGYGVKEYFITQDLKQLNDAYGRDNSIVGNCHIKIAYTANEPDTGKYISEALGNTTVVEKKVSTSSGKGGRSRSVSINETARPLLTPDECTRLPGLKKEAGPGGKAVSGGNMIIFPSGHAPIYGEQILYFKDPFFSEKSKIKAPTESPVADEFADPNKLADASGLSVDLSDEYKQYLDE